MNPERELAIDLILSKIARHGKACTYEEFERLCDETEARIANRTLIKDMERYELDQALALQNVCPHYWIILDGWCEMCSYHLDYHSP